MDIMDHGVTRAIYPSTSYRKKSETHNQRTDLTYGRMKCPNFDEAEHVIKKLYQSTNALLCSSGLNALYCTIQGLLEFRGKKKVVLIADKELYCSSRHQLKYLANRESFSLITADFTDHTSVLDHVKKPTQFYILYTETCSNPSGRMMDTTTLTTEMKKKNVCFCLVVDNSWLSVGYNPFEHGADILIESATKYMGGGDLIMGVITSRENKWFGAIKNHTIQAGIRVSPHDAYNLTKSLSTLTLRIQKSAPTTLQLATWLESKQAKEQTCIRQVRHPLLPSHPTFSVAEAYLRLGPSVFTVLVDLDRKATMKVIESSHLIQFATSYGKQESLFDPWPKQGPDGTWIRIAVGHGDTFDDLQKELVRLFPVGEKQEKFPPAPSTDDVDTDTTRSQTAT